LKTTALLVASALAARANSLFASALAVRASALSCAPTNVSLPGRKPPIGDLSPMLHENENRMETHSQHFSPAPPYLS
jgi:hypothetical protein